MQTAIIVLEEEKESLKNAIKERMSEIQKCKNLILNYEVSITAANEEIECIEDAIKKLSN